MVVDSNLIIYATQPHYAVLRTWLLDHASHYAAITRLEVLGYPKLDSKERQAVEVILQNLELLMITTLTLEIAIELRQQHKMSLGDALIAANCLEWQLPLATRNVTDFEWVKDLELYNPMD